MGRPLKIAKAQTVLTITSTNGTTEVVTVSQTLADVGVIAGMPFVVATNVGGLIAGTTYWILAITGASTFTVSANPLNANPTYTPVNLSNAGPVTVATTVGLVGSGFNNPDGAANTYSVVGGNTAFYGKQVLVGAAIGRSGTGTLYSDATANNDPTLYGAGSNLASQLSTGSAIQVAVSNINGRTDFVNVGFASATIGNITVAVANTNATGNVIRTTGNAQTLSTNKPITFSANLGGLVTGTTYFVKSIANATAFTVSATQGGADVALSTATGTPNAVQNRVVLTANCPIVFNGASFIYADDEAAFIVRQKGKQKYLVTGATTGLTAQCLTANVANTALTPNTMTITATYANAATARVQSLSDHTGELFTATSGPIATGNIVLQNASPVFVTFNSAATANTANAQPYPIVQINNS